jgi:UDP-glucose 4-epimerase
MKKESALKKNNTTPIRFFITGGAGFIGSHLADRLLAEGNSVTVFDNLASGSKENIKHQFNNPNFKFVEANLLDSNVLDEAIKGHDVVCHLAATANIAAGNEATDIDLKNGTIATYNVLEAMRKSSTHRILFTSSAAIYGPKGNKAISEEDGPYSPISLYGAGKLASEGLCTAYCHLYNIQAWIFRFGNVIGNRMEHGVIHDFVNKLIQNPKELQILGDGKQNKNYFLVEDCIEGMLCAFHNTANAYDYFNIGNDKNITVTNIAEVIVEEMGLKNVQFRYTGGASGWKGDIPTVYLNISKMGKLGWKPQYNSLEAVRIAARRIIKDATNK